jgi:hypothetical protein
MPERRQIRRRVALGVQFVEIAVPAELLDGHQVLRGRDPQLRDQFAWRQQGAQRDQHGADSGQRDGGLHLADSVGHDQPDSGALGHPGLQKCRRRRVRPRIEFAVGDPVNRIDHHRLVRVLGGAKPNQLIDG